MLGDGNGATIRMCHVDEMEHGDFCRVEIDFLPWPLHSTRSAVSCPHTGRALGANTARIHVWLDTAKSWGNGYVSIRPGQRAVNQGFRREREERRDPPSLSLGMCLRRVLRLLREKLRYAFVYVYVYFYDTPYFCFQSPFSFFFSLPRLVSIFLLFYCFFIYIYIFICII